jgi:hypothetical protein
MKSTRLFVFLLTAITLLHVAAANAAGIDMEDPRRALGRENDVRVDAQVLNETVSPGMPIAVTCQIQNFTATPVAIAERIADASYDEESRTITFAIGSEIPTGDSVPRLVLIGPGEKKVFRVSATPVMNVRANSVTRFGNAPRFIQVKVNILRELGSFNDLIARQAAGPQPMSNELFDRWLESNDTIYLNSLPVHFAPRTNAGAAERRGMAGGF